MLIFEFSRLFSNLVFDILSLAFLTDFFPNLVLSTFPKGKGKQQVIENLQNSENGLIISFFLICLRKLRRDPEKQVYSVWCIAKALKKKRLDYEVLSSFIGLATKFLSCLVCFSNKAKIELALFCDDDASFCVSERECLSSDQSHFS